MVELHVFHSKQCGLCHEQIKVLKLWKPPVPVLLIDVDKLPDYEKAANIEGTPTTVILQNKKEVHRFVGLTSAPPMQVVINQLIY